jgi:serine/threonine-protein kinase
MTPNSVPARPGACPSRDELSAFSRGELPDAALERLAEHLSGCAPCASTLEGLRAADTVVARLREAVQGSPVAEPGLEALEARALALAPDLARTASDLSAATEAAPAEAEPLPRPFGPYELLERLGHGGMGVVYKARQTALNRLVALKRLHAGPYAGPEERARFRTEAEAIARLRHPNVVQVYEVGEHEGQLYLSMELVEGGSLGRRLADGPLPEREAAELVRALARAVEAVHGQRIVHRDLKPGNVLLESDGTPKVSDFGLAKLLDAEAGHTRTGAVMGTAAYMAPEQAEGRSREVGPATDVYALGTILYQALTGRPPFQGENRSAVLDQVRGREPVPPGRLRPRLSRDLEAVCLKCLEKEPQKRYATAEALADDLGRWLRGKPTAVRPPGRARRVLRWLRRRWRWLTMGLAAAAAVAAAALLWPKDPDRPVKEIEARLARGEAVTLIGETGGPKWYRWAEGGQEAQAVPERDGTFAVHCSASLALLELASDPRRTRFRLSAEVRHITSSARGEVGVYFGRRTYPTPGGPVQHFGAMTYNDIDDEVKYWKEKFAPKLPPGSRPPPGNRITLFPHLYAQGGNKPWEPEIGGERSYFKRSGLDAAWRQLSLEVTPDGVEGLWEGLSIGKITASRWERDTETYLAATQAGPSAFPLGQGLAFTYAPSGGLGLYVYHGSAAFRHVVVEPLAEPN